MNGNRKEKRLLGLVMTLTLALLAMIALAACDLGGDGDTSNNRTPGPTNPDAPEATETTNRPLIGTIVDANTGEPVANAEIIAGGVLTATAADGRFYFDDVPPNSIVEVLAEGYEGAQVLSVADGELAVQLRPNSLGGKVTDASTGQPLAGVLVRLDYPKPAPPPAEPVTPTGTLTDTPEVEPTVALTESRRVSGLAAPLMATPGDDDGTPEPTSVGTPVATPVPPTPTLTPTPAKPPPTGEGFVAAYTDANGEYLFKSAPPGSSLTFKIPGYALTRMPADAPRKDVALEIFKAEAIYITANMAASRDLLDPLIEWAQTSRINSIVLNVQNDASEWIFDVQNADVREADNTDIFLPNMADLVKELQGKGFYMIARVVAFQQKTMAEQRPDWAVMSSVSGEPWKGGYGGHQKWLDASNPEAQDHLIDMTKEVLALGFDEIQYDYIRFPSDPATSEKGKMVFSKPLTDTGKIASLQQFLQKAHAVMEPTNQFLSIDVFGYAIWPDFDGEPYLGVIGQSLPELIDYVDYVSPMIYPSHFVSGEQGCKVPAACAYELIEASGKFAKPRFEGKKAKYRPWLQVFDWGPTDYTSKSSKRVQQQMQACEDTDCWGWMMWDPTNVYSPRVAFEKEE